MIIEATKRLLFGKPILWGIYGYRDRRFPYNRHGKLLGVKEFRKRIPPESYELIKLDGKLYEIVNIDREYWSIEVEPWYPFYS